MGNAGGTLLGEIPGEPRSISPSTACSAPDSRASSRELMARWSPNAPASLILASTFPAARDTGTIMGCAVAQATLTFIAHKRAVNLRGPGSPRR
jgi:hypothetical protein